LYENKKHINAMNQTRFQKKRSNPFAVGTTISFHALAFDGLGGSISDMCISLKKLLTNETNSLIYCGCSRVPLRRVFGPEVPMPGMVATPQNRTAAGSY
jgi:hypothetical protein